MNELVKQIAKQATEDGRKTIRKAIRTIVTQVETDFMAQAMKCLDEYYDEYPMPPRQYQRTNNLYHNVARPYRRYRPNEVDVGVRFSSDEMDEYKWTSKNPFNSKYFNTLEDLVVSNALDGYHGEAYIAPRTSTIDYKMQQFEREYGAKVLDNYFRDLGFEV